MTSILCAHKQYLLIKQASALNNKSTEQSADRNRAFDFQQNFFELFGLPESCVMDSSALRSAFMALQRDHHPDKHAAAKDDADRLLAVRIASFINEAHQTLSVPLRRAEYCLQLRGVSTDTETDAKMDPGFLMEQMEWRETLEAVDLTSDAAYDHLDKLKREITASVKAVAGNVEAQLEASDLQAARDSVRQWQFLSKLVGEIDAAEARVDEATGQ